MALGRLPFSRSSPPGHAAVMRCGMCKCIGSVLYSAVSAVTGWADCFLGTVCWFCLVFCYTGSSRLSPDCCFGTVYCFCLVFCCTGSSRLSRLLLWRCLLLLHCLLLRRWLLFLYCLLFLAEWESGLRSRPISWIVAYRCYSGTGLLCRPLFMRSK